MNPILSVIIPYDNSSLETLNTSLTFIDNQLKVDWSKGKVEVVLLHNEDVEDVDTSAYPNVGQYIKSITLGGNDAERKQYAVNTSKAEYVTFLPIGAMFSSAIAIHNIIENITKHKKDVFFFQVIDEGKRDDQNNEKYRDQKNDLVGKVFSTTFLAKNNIGFYGGISCYEEVAFSKLALAANPQYYYSSSPAFLYTPPTASYDIGEYLGSRINAEFAISVDNVRKTTYKVQRELVALCHNTYYDLNTREVPQEVVEKSIATLGKYIGQLSNIVLLTDLFNLDFTAMNITYTNVDGAETFDEFMKKVLEGTNE